VLRVAPRGGESESAGGGLELRVAALTAAVLLGPAGLGGACEAGGAARVTALEGGLACAALVALRVVSVRALADGRAWSEWPPSLLNVDVARAVCRRLRGLAVVAGATYLAPVLGYLLELRCDAGGGGLIARETAITLTLSRAADAPARAPVRLSGGVEEARSRILSALSARRSALSAGLSSLLPHAALVVGPSGCGKSLLLRALAEEAGAGNCARLDCTRLVLEAEGGRSFAEHAAGARTLLLVDHLDALVATGGAAAARGDRPAGDVSRQPRLSGLGSGASRVLRWLCGALELGAQSRHAPFLVAACSERSLALLPSRLADRSSAQGFPVHLSLSALTRAERAELLSRLLPQFGLVAPGDAALLLRAAEAVADATPGFVGGDLVRFARLARAAQAEAAEAAAAPPDDVPDSPLLPGSPPQDSPAWPARPALPPAPPPEQEQQRQQQEQPQRDARDGHDAAVVRSLVQLTRRVRPAALGEGSGYGGAGRASLDVDRGECRRGEWAGVGGYEGAKRRLEQLLLWNASFPTQAEGGILLYGPSGCGKTLLAHAMARESGLQFLSVKASELSSMYVGESERLVREAFARARRVAPSILFLDEIDAVACKRDLEGAGAGASAVATRVLASLLNEMDGISARGGVTVLAATSRRDSLDAALLRPGRLGCHVWLGPPEQEDREAVLREACRALSLAPDVDLTGLAQAAPEGCTCAQLSAWALEAAMAALRDGATAVTRAHFDQRKHHVWKRPA
jgi:ATP-dependent 26S proteasome regulatory subunit